MIQIKTFSPQGHKIKALIYGSPGSGKTFFGGTAPKPIFASAEGGLLSIADKNPDYVEIKTYKDLQALHTFLKNEKHDYETVVIDSITEINEMIKYELEKSNRRSMQLQDWGVLHKKITLLLRDFRDLPMHVILTAHDEIKQDGEDVSKILPMLNGKAANQIPGFMDVVGYAFVKGGNHYINLLPNDKTITKTRWKDLAECGSDFSEWVKKISEIKIKKEKVKVEFDQVISTVNTYIQELEKQKGEVISDKDAVLQKFVESVGGESIETLTDEQIERLYRLFQLAIDKEKTQKDHQDMQPKFKK